jgi:hypothetical protein
MELSENSLISGYNLWQIISSRGIFIKIQNAIIKKVLDLDSNLNDVILAKKDDKKTSQEWFFDNGNKIVNRINFRALTATIDDTLVLKVRSNEKGKEFQTWLRETVK